MPRKLSQSEKDYIIANHEKMSPEKMCADMLGIGPNTVMSFILGDEVRHNKDNSSKNKKEQ